MFKAEGIVKVYVNGKFHDEQNKLITNNGLKALILTCISFPRTSSLPNPGDIINFNENTPTFILLKGHNIGTGTTPPTANDTNLEAPLFPAPINTNYAIFNFSDNPRAASLTTFASFLINNPPTNPISEYGVFFYIENNHYLFDRATISPISPKPRDLITIEYTLKIST